MTKPWFVELYEQRRVEYAWKAWKGALAAYHKSPQGRVTSSPGNFAVKWRKT